MESAEKLYQRNVARILTDSFPCYFAIVTRIRQDVKTLGPKGGVIVSSVVPQVQAQFPEGALTKAIKIGLQVSSGNWNSIQKYVCRYTQYCLANCCLSNKMHQVTKFESL